MASTPPPGEAGPSTPRISPPSSSPQIPEIIEPDNAAAPAPTTDEPPTAVTATPAPWRPSQPPIAPDAPPHAPPAKELPTETPASSHTPSTRLPADLAEFDPFSTPVPPAPAPRPQTPPPTSTPTTSRAPAASVSAGVVPRMGVSGDGPGTPSGSGQPGEPAFNFSGFLKDLRAKSADPIARYLKSFLSNFAKKPFTVNEQIKLIHDFLSFIADKMTQCEPWKSQTPAEFDNAMEAMEKLVMNRLYNYTFTPQLVASQPVTTDDLERDAVFAQRVRLFSWVREKHLDVPEGEASQGFMGFAEQELLKINHYKAPRDKMICILNCCKVIFGLIRHTYGADATSADAFVPILIFVVLQANPENMLSNIEYISRFRTPSKLQGEAGYYLSSLSGAIAFIETMDASSLSSITQEEFEANVEQAIQELPPSPTSQLARPLPAGRSTDTSPFSPVASGEEPAKPLAISAAFPALDNTKRFFQRTGNLATEAVSKPLNAIGKILDDMRQAEQEGSEDGDTDGEEVERRWQAGGERDRESEQRHDRVLGSASGAGQSTPRRQQRLREMMTPETPSRVSGAYLGTSPTSATVSGSATPSGEVPLPDFSSLQLRETLESSQEAYEQTRRANVQTLHQMFPDLDEDVVEAVLDSCGDDLGLAIDRLLEM